MSGAVIRRPAAAAAKAPPRAPQGRGMASVMNFYTDDSPGIKMSPSLVVMMSVGFIAFVTVLHIIGKLRGL